MMVMLCTIASSIISRQCDQYFLTTLVFLSLMADLQPLGDCSTAQIGGAAKNLMGFNVFPGAKYSISEVWGI